MILSVTLNPCVDNTLTIDGLKPNDTNKILKFETDAGGKGINLSRVASALGAETLATGFLGGKQGAFIRSVLDRDGVSHSFIEVLEETRTNTSVEDGTEKPPTTFNAQGPTISESDWVRLINKVSDLSTNVKWVTLGGSLPPGVPADAYKILGELAKNTGAKVALDADGEAALCGLRSRPHFFKPNIFEAGRLLGREINTVEEVISGAQELLRKLEDDGVCVVSMGKRGAVMASSNGILVGNAIEVETKSTIGSGDSMLAGMLVSIMRGEDTQTAFEWGFAAGAATAMTDGATIADKASTESLLPLALVRRVH